MIQSKICMLGATSVGKTSLVARFVRSMFSEKYLTSIGVKIDSKAIRVAGTDLMLMLWDLQGDDEFQRLRASYLRGALGLFFVADGTRKETLDVVRRLSLKHTLSPSVPRVLALNKADLSVDWEVTESDLAPFVRDGSRSRRHGHRQISPSSGLVKKKECQRGRNVVNARRIEYAVRPGNAGQEGSNDAMSS